MFYLWLCWLVAMNYGNMLESWNHGKLNFEFIRFVTYCAACGPESLFCLFSLQLEIYVSFGSLKRDSIKLNKKMKEGDKVCTTLYITTKQRSLKCIRRYVIEQFLQTSLFCTLTRIFGNVLFKSRRKCYVSRSSQML